MRTLVVENIDHYEDRFRSYLRTIEGDFVEHFSLNTKSAKETMDIFKTPNIDQLCFESMLTNDRQLIGLIGQLIKFKDEISFKKIIVFSSRDELDSILTQKAHEDDVLRVLLKDLFTHYEVYGVTWRMYESYTQKQTYLKKLIFKFDTVKLSSTLVDDLDVYYYTSLPIIDPRAHIRDYKLVKIPKTLANSEIRKNFFDEVWHMLEHQKDMIECHNEKNKEELLQENQDRILYLEYLQSITQ